MHLSHWLNLFRQHRKLTINRRVCVCVCLRKSAKSPCVARWARPAAVSTLSPVPSLQLPQFVHATPLRMRSHRIRANSLTLVRRICRRLRPLCAAFPLFHIWNLKLANKSNSGKIFIQLRTVLHRIHRVPAAPRAWNADRRQHQAGVVPDRVHSTSRSRVLWPPNMPHPSRHSDRKWLLCPPVDRSWCPLRAPIDLTRTVSV